MLKNAKILDIPGKGKGIVATQKIHQNCLILEETPVIILETEKIIREDIREQLFSHFLNLEQNLQNEVWKLCPENGEIFNPEGLYYKFKSNAFVNTETDDFNLFLTASRFNHSCLPNVGRDFSVNSKGEVVQRFFAIRDIEIGEELEICYNTEEEEFSRSTVERIKFYAENNDFECSCVLCSNPSDETDGIRLNVYNLINEIDEEEDSFTGMQLIKFLFKTLEKYKDVVAGRQDLYRIYSEMGFNAACVYESKSECQFFGEKVLFYRKITKGENHEGVQEIENMLKENKFDFL